MSLRANGRDLALAVAVASATVVWRTGASPVAAIISGLVSAAIALSVHRVVHRVTHSA